MTIPRMLVLLIGLSAIGVAVVAVRVEESRVLRRIERLQTDKIEADRELRATEMRLWSLRSPPVIRERSAQVLPAGDGPDSPRSGEAKTAPKKR